MAMNGSYHREVGPIVQVIRTFLRGRSWNEQLRKPKDLTPRPYAQPFLPIGPSDKTSDNYYYTRDGRRTVEQPMLLMDKTRRQLTSGEKSVKAKSVPKAGIPYMWD